MPRLRESIRAARAKLNTRIDAAVRDAWARTLAHGTGRWLALAGAVGLLCGAAGFVFDLGVNLISCLTLGRMVGYLPLLSGPTVPIPAADRFWPWLAIPVVGIGGAVAGWLATRFSPEAAGGGTDLAVEAFHHRRGEIGIRTTLAKLATAFATLGCGGSAGREGPITLVGAGFGSWLAGRLGLTIHDRRTLLVAGIAGGIAAVFHAPLAATLFAAEVLYRGRGLEAEALIPSAISAVVGFVSSSLLDGSWNALVGADSVLTGTLISVPAGLAFTAAGWSQLVGYLLVAIICAGTARLFIGLMSLTHHAARGTGWPLSLRSGIGGALAAAVAIGCLLLLDRIDGGPAGHAGFAILGPGYAVLQKIFDQAQGWLWAVALLLIAAAKMLATACTVGTGGSGGVFAPSLVIGGCLGAAVGIACSGLAIAPPVAACAVVGMGAFLAASHRTPIAALLMVCELSGTYGLLIPAMWTTGLAVLLTGERTLIHPQVGGESDSPAHRTRNLRDLFREATVADVLDRSRAVPVLAPDSTLSDCRRAVCGSDLDAFPVLDRDGRLLGLVSLGDVRQFLDERGADDLVRVADLVEGRSLALNPEDDLSRALRRFTAGTVEDLPVLDRDGRLLGMLRRADLFRWYAARMERHAVDLRAEGHDAESGTWEQGPQAGSTRS